MNEESKNGGSKAVKNYYQGIYLTETVMGNPNGDFIDNSPRNFDGKVFTTDKCIKYNVRKYIHDEKENIVLNNEGQITDIDNFVFFYPRKDESNEAVAEAGFLTKESIIKKYLGIPKDKEALDEIFKNYVLNKCPDVRMFGGTFSLKNTVFEKGGQNVNKQIYGPIQLSYGLDINDAQIKRLQIGAPFSSTQDGDQTTIGSEAVVDDAIISYDITINPNNYPGLLRVSDLELLKTALWYGTNIRKSTSKKTDSKLLILIKFKNTRSDDRVTALNIGELKELIKIENKDDRKRFKDPEKKIKIDTTALTSKLKDYTDYIEEIEIYRDETEVEIKMQIEGLDANKIKEYCPINLLSKNSNES